MLLAPGAPPMIQIDGLWRSMSTEMLTPADLVALGNERLGLKPDGITNGYAYLDFSYGDVARFRVMAFGYPRTTLLLLARWPEK